MIDRKAAICYLREWEAGEIDPELWTGLRYWRGGAAGSRGSLSFLGTESKSALSVSWWIEHTSHWVGNHLTIKTNQTLQRRSAASFRWDENIPRPRMLTKGLCKCDLMRWSIGHDKITRVISCPWIIQWAARLCLTTVHSLDHSLTEVYRWVLYLQPQSASPAQPGDPTQISQHAPPVPGIIRTSYIIYWSHYYFIYIEWSSRTRTIEYVVSQFLEIYESQTTPSEPRKYCPTMGWQCQGSGVRCPASENISCLEKSEENKVGNPLDKIF